VSLPPRAGRRRARSIGGALALALLTLAPVAPARAGSFRVSQCATADAGALSPRGYQASLWSVSNGWPAVSCGSAGGAIRIGTPNWRLRHNDDTTTRFALPGSMPATTLRAAWLDWSFPHQATSVNPAYLVLTSAGARQFHAAAGTSGAGERRTLPDGARGAEFVVWCSPVNGPGWCNWPAHLLELRGLTFELEEDGEPGGGMSGPLLAAGERSGVEPVEVSAFDGDSGVRRVTVLLGGMPVGTVEPAEGCRDDRLPPCPRALREIVDVDTRAVADGPQRLRLVVLDAAGNQRVIDSPHPVLIRNQPRIDVPPAGDGAPGGTGAGVNAGGPPGRAPMAAEPPRPFPPNPLAGRGGVANGRNASERARVSAWLEPPGRTLRRRRSVTVPPGVRVRIRGRVTDERGRPIGRATLAAVRRALPNSPWRVVTGVRTRPNGRFTAFSRIGPSQELRFVYYARGDSTRGRRSATLRVNVRAA
jgi:hypothetical protein